MLRIGLKFLSFLLCFQRLTAQNLNLEFDLENQIQFEHISGAGPSLMECRLAKNNIMGCSSSKKIKEAFCFSVSSQSLKENIVVKSSVLNSSFRCEGAKGLSEQVFAQSWRVLLVGIDLKQSEWIIHATSKEQMKKASSQELEYNEKNTLQTAQWTAGTYAGFNTALAAPHVGFKLGHELLAQHVFWGKRVWTFLVDKSFLSNTLFSAFAAYEFFPFMDDTWNFGAYLKMGTRGEMGYRLSEIDAGAIYRSLSPVGSSLDYKIGFIWPFAKYLDRSFELEIKSYKWARWRRYSLSTFAKYSYLSFRDRTIWKKSGFDVGLEINMEPIF